MPKQSDFVPGDWNASCFECGRKRKASQLRRHWQGYYVCPEHWEPRHPQDFVKAVPDHMEVPWAQPMADTDLQICTPNGITAMPGRGMPGCMMPGNSNVIYEDDPVVVPSLCDIYGITSIPSFAMPGCSLPGEDPIAP